MSQIYNSKRMSASFATIGYFMLLLQIGLASRLALAQANSVACQQVPARLKQVVPIPSGEPADHLLYSYHALQYLSCEYMATYPEDKHASTTMKQNPKHLDAASKVWVYALMASNAYRTKGQVFIIPGWEVTSRWESKSGLGLEEWVHKGADGTPDEYVIAFEGTGSFDDWQTNLSLVYPRQFKEAYAYMQCLQARVKGVRIVTTGHSLGGAIALNMSLRLPGIDYRGFDMSPRGFRHTKRPYASADRLFIYEKGEILSVLRPLWLKLDSFDQRYWYNFMKFKGGSATIKNHDMYLIARGLLLLAVKSKNEEARQAFVANLSSKIASKSFEDGDVADLPRDVEACDCILQNRPQTSSQPVPQP